MKKIYSFVLAALALALVATPAVAEDLMPTTDPLILQARGSFEPIPLAKDAGFARLKGNKATPEKLALGKMLYFEPRLSKSQLISCNTCHNLANGGDDYQETSIGHGWAKGPRNAPTVLNAVYNHAQFWDGRADDLKAQSKGPIQASVEMAATPDHVVKVLTSMPEYVALFKKAFPGQKNPVTFDNMANAIEVFEATLLTPNSKLDKFLRGDANALSKVEKEGLKVYMDKGCDGCHGGINLTSDGYHEFGVKEAPAKEITGDDKGRVVAGKAEGFKAPTLRNIEYTAPYFHSGKVWSLEEAVALMSNAQLGIKLNKKEVQQIVAFLKTTTGEQPKVDYPTLPPSTNATPKPVYK